MIFMIFSATFCTCFTGCSSLQISCASAKHDQPEVLAILGLWCESPFELKIGTYFGLQASCTRPPSKNQNPFTRVAPRTPYSLRGLHIISEGFIIPPRTLQPAPAYMCIAMQFIFGAVFDSIWNQKSESTSRATPRT